jgi:hypothetical protein
MIKLEEGCTLKATGYVAMCVGLSRALTHHWLFCMAAAYPAIKTEQFGWAEFEGKGWSCTG